MDQDATCYESRPWSGQHCVRCGPSSAAKGAQLRSSRPMSIAVKRSPISAILLSTSLGLLIIISVCVQCRLLVVFDQAPVVITLVILGGLYGTALASVYIVIVFPRMFARSVSRIIRPRLVIRPPRFSRPPRLYIIRYYPSYGAPRSPGQPRFHNRYDCLIPLSADINYQFVVHLLQSSSSSPS